jgi:ribose-phosphate pyrophosphokinase
MTVYHLPDPSPLEKRLLKRLGSASGFAQWKTYPAGEISVRLKRVSREAIVLGRTHAPAENFLRTLLLVETLKRHGARRIRVVIPYFAYSRADRETEPRESIALTTWLKLLKAAGVDELITLDAHSGALSDPGPMRVKRASVLPDMAAVVCRLMAGALFTVVAPDAGAKERACRFAKDAGGTLAWCTKSRSPSGPRLLGCRGDLKTKTAVLVDDILDTGGTIEAAAKFLRKKGVRRLLLCVPHAVFSEDAVKRVRALGFERILVCESMPLSPAVRSLPGLVVVDAAPAIADIL